MAATLPDIELDYTWTDLNTVSGIAEGAEMEGQNKGYEFAQIVESVAEPAADYLDGKKVSPQQHGYANFLVLAGSIRVWIRSASKSKETIVSVQAL